MRSLKNKVDFCVVGGGLSGMCAAIAAARHGVKVALMHDRPVLGGNASSEIRMHACGAAGENTRETGIIEEIRLENAWRNPNLNYSIWDSILYEKVRFEPNILLILNCSVNSLEMDGARIKSVTGWQSTTETWHTVSAPYFADCTGDGILAPLSGAEFRMGREAQAEFDESFAPKEADCKTMGMSCLMQFRETDRPQKFIPPSWAYIYNSPEDMNNRLYHNVRLENFWWIEVGGDKHSIHDTEEMRDELLKIVFGVADYIKNRSDSGAENWVLDWVGFLPGKRESRRLIGDYILKQQDILEGREFKDTVAYGAWPIDDHHPAGFYHKGSANAVEYMPNLYQIPYRCLYSKNIENLFFAGRNISASHVALSSTRVMATCALLGQATGTAASIAARDSISPRDVCPEELQQVLMDDDCYLPGKVRSISRFCRGAKLSSNEGDPSVLLNGVDRPVGDADNGWFCKPGGWAQITLPQKSEVKDARIIFDSNLVGNGIRMVAFYPLDNSLPPHLPARVPPSLVKAFRIEVQDGGKWKTVLREENNYQRLVKIPLSCPADSVRLVVEGTWGAPKAHVMAFEVG
jgi:hypothetical protein